MEKVDILEMTVRYLQDQRHSFLGCAGSSQSLATKYIEGYSECASQVGQYLSSTKELSEDMRRRLSQHLFDSLRRNTLSAHHTSPSAEPQTTGILSIGQPIDSHNPFSSAVNTNSASTMLKTSVQNPAILSTKFAVLETETGSLSPSTCSRVIIPFYLSSPCSATPSILPITHSSGQLLASATFQPLSASPLFSPSRSTPSTPSPMPFASSGSPNHLKSWTTPQIITGNCDLLGNSVCCSSPKHGDECPSSASLFTSDGVRSLIQNFNPSISIHSSISPPVLPAVATLHVDRRRQQQTVPAELVWRPWNDCAGKMS